MVKIVSGELLENQCLMFRDVFQLHHGHGGEQCAADRAGSQLSPQTPGHTQHAHLGENWYLSLLICYKLFVWSVWRAMTMRHYHFSYYPCPCRWCYLLQSFENRQPNWVFFCFPPRTVLWEMRGGCVMSLRHFLSDWTSGGRGFCYKNEKETISR